jgi:acetyl esterase/lipase
MTKQSRCTGVAGLAVLGLAIAACPAAANSHGIASRAQLGACPKTQPTGPPPPRPVGVPIATSVAESDTSTSVVIEATGPQIRCGRTKVDTYSDVVYATPATAGGAPVALKLDLLVPETRGRKPLVVWFPGGGFINADKGGSLDHRTYVAEAGYAVASVQYRTITSGATYADGVADAKSAIRYLRANARRYGIDPRRVAAWGESAGGYMAAMVGTTNGIERFDAGGDLDQSSAVQAVVDQFGPSDLSKLGADFDPAFQAQVAAPGTPSAQWVFGPGTTKSVNDDPAAIARANPATYADSSDPAFLLFHGSADHLVSPSQTLLVHDALLANGVDSTRYVLSGADHGDLAFLGQPEAVIPWSTRKAMNLIVRFLHEHIRD